MKKGESAQYIMLCVGNQKKMKSLLIFLALLLYTLSPQLVLGEDLITEHYKLTISSNCAEGHDTFAQQEDVSEIQKICRYWNLSKKLEMPIQSCIEAAKQGDSKIQTYIGIYYLERSDFKNAKEWFEKAAIQGDPNAQNGLGYLYQFGYGVEKDRKKANELFLKSAKQGNPDSQYWLGENLFLEGQQKEGFKWSRKAAENGSKDAQYNIAIMYKKGQGVEEDQVQSYLWFSIAARNGHNNAQEYINYFNSKLPKDVLDEMTTYVENSIKKNPKYINK